MAESPSHDVNLYGPVGETFDGEGVSAGRFDAMLADVDPADDLTVHVNSPGGNVFDGLTIYQTLAARTGHNEIIVQGVAASIAATILMAGDEIVMNQSSRIMIHDPMGPSAIAFGTADDLREAAEDTLQTAELLDSVRDTLADVFAARTNAEREDIREWMSSETWFNARAAAEKGFADRVIPNKSVAAKAWINPVVCQIKHVEELERIARLAAMVQPRDRVKERKLDGRRRTLQSRLRLTETSIRS